MIAYNPEWLSHLNIRKDADDAFDEYCITKEEREAIYKKYPVGFYSPNVFIGIGLLLLTIIILSFTFGLFALMTGVSNEKAFGVLNLFFGAIAYTALEVMIREKKHYSSGVDEGLLWMASIAIFSGVWLLIEPGALASCILIFILGLFGTVRYADRLMATVLYLSFVGILFYCCTKLGTAGKAIAPFMIMAASLACYLLVKRSKLKRSLLNYMNCLTMIEIVALISLYAAGNYCVVRELSNEMFDLHLRPLDSIPLGWLFWIFTAIIPVIYLAIGIRNKNTILIRVGLLLVAAIVFTVRYYHSILPIEVMMTVAGILILAIAYGLMKWLRKPVHGFTSNQLSSKNEPGKLQIESLIIAQTFKPGTDVPDTKFGGGNFGGGGASGDY